MRKSGSNESINQRDVQLQRPDPEHIAAQVEEVTALSIIYPDEFRLLSSCRSSTNQSSASADSNGDDLLADADYYHYEAYEHPIRYQVDLMVDDDANADDSVCRVCSRTIDDGAHNGKASPPCSSTQNGAQQQLSSTPTTTVVLHVEYPIHYPDVPPHFSLEMITNCDKREGDSSSDHHDLVLQAILDAIEEGVPCVLQCVQAGRDMWHDLQQQQQKQRWEREGQQQLQQSKDDDHLMFFDNLPRPILNTILDHYCNVQDRCRLAVASRCVWIILEQRAQRIVATTCDNHDHNHNYWVTSMGGRGWTVDGIAKECWELDVRHAQEQFQILSFQEQLWRRERCVTFHFWDDLPEPLVGEPRRHWRIREGLRQRQLAKTTATGDAASNNSHNNDSNRSWIISLDDVPEMCFYFSRTTTTTFSHPIHSSERSWYLVRVHFRALHPYDGDICVGVVRDAYDKMPHASFVISLCLGFGEETEQSAFINAIHGPNGVLAEVNVGLVVQGSKIEYGIPIDGYYGRPAFNRGTVSSSIRRSRSTELADDPADFARIAVVLAASSEQSAMRASVTFQQCLEKEWKEKMVTPYNHL